MSVTHSKLNWRNPKVYQTWLTLTGFEKRSHKYINFETKLKNPQACFEENSCKRASWNDWIIYRKRLYKGGRSFSGGTLCGIWESGERQKSSRDLGSLYVGCVLDVFILALYLLSHVCALLEYTLIQCGKGSPFLKCVGSIRVLPK